MKREMQVWWDPTAKHSRICISLGVACKTSEPVQGTVYADSSGHVCAPSALVLLDSYPLSTFPFLDSISLCYWPHCCWHCPSFFNFHFRLFGLDNDPFSSYTFDSFAWFCSSTNSMNQWMLETNIFPDSSTLTILLSALPLLLDSHLMHLAQVKGKLCQKKYSMALATE